MREFVKGYYFITDAKLSRNGIFEDVKAAIKAGVKIFQYREKNKSTREMLYEALELRKLINDGVLIINDRVDIAIAAGADGVHIGQDDMPVSITRRLIGIDKIIGVTVHNLLQAQEAEKEGADYIAVSPIFHTTTKLDAENPVGVQIISEIKKFVCLPAVAIGGITLENAKEAIEAGADAICAISAVLTKNNVEEEIRKFQKLFNNGGQR
ncbi:MAG: thiamine phosphate synthase [Candidatus Omnitrophica bacterium]|nr:thiamine phosphate synthase [Candidatus Omnitrophota bacterium]MCM8816939.1 thiamine phosphate synthase [Candidatus Omnitrophota bacterium]